jgi:hypothetical protein
MKRRILILPTIFYSISLGFLLIMSSEARGQLSLVNSADPSFNENTRPVEGTLEEGIAIHSNVPLNEIKVRAFRHFRKNFPTISDETWFKYDQGYLVSFVKNSWRNQVHYDLRGSFLYSLKYYTGAAIDKTTGSLIERRFPGYQIDVVTEITNGEKTFYLVTIKNPSYVKTISVCDGTIELLKEFINGA